MANYTIALSTSNISPLVLPEKNGQFAFRYYVPFTAIVTSASITTTDTITLTLGNTPTNWTVQSAYAFVSPAFTAATAAGTGSAQTVTMSVGTTTVLNAFIASGSILSAGLIQPANGINSVTTPASSIGTTSIGMVALFTGGVTGNFSSSSITSGALEIILGIFDPSQTS